MIIKSLKKFLENKIEVNLIDIEHMLSLDFEPMGLENDISIGSSIIIDFDKLNNDRKSGTTSISINSSDIGVYEKGYTNNSLTIDLFKESQVSEINIDDFEDAYNILSEFLKEEYDLIPNYIYVNYHWSYLYFENVEMLRLYLFGGHLGDDPNTGWYNSRVEKGSKYFKAHKVILGFYKK